MLFRGREKEKTAAKQAPSAAVPQPEPKPQGEEQAARFSQRIAGVFGKMYRAIVSVDLKRNVYQLESGESSVAGTALPVRGYYDAWVSQMRGSMSPDSAEQFARDFGREPLCARFADGEDGVSGEYAQMEAPQENAPEDAATYVTCEIRADRIPEQDDSRVRCIIYVRTVKGKEPVVAPSEPDAAEAAQELDWNRIRLHRLLGGKATFFEYDTVSDVMTIHHEGKLSVVQNYLRVIETRADWTVFHNDLPTVKKLLTNASKGQFGSAEIQYRAGGVRGAEYRCHRVVCAPAQDGTASRWVVGTLLDIEDETQKDSLKRDIYSYLLKLLAYLYTIFEIDTNRGEIFTVRYTENGFVRDAQPIKLEAYIDDLISRGVIHKEYTAQYKNWLRSDFLNRKTSNGSYEFESRLKLAGSLDYRWYSETIYRVEGTQRFLRARRDTTDNHAAQRRKYELEEQGRNIEYNRNMLDTMAGLVEFRNVESGLHIANVRHLTKLLLEDVTARSVKYSLSAQQIEILSEAATMHDVGKIAVPDYILNKPSKLTDEEREIMKRHTTDGARIIDRLNLPGQEELIACCRDVALHHHERYDGSGYPEGLVGDKISIGAQAVSVADVFDALVSVRCYKPGLARQEAYDIIIAEGKAGRFNPIIIESFQACYEKFNAANDSAPQPDGNDEK